MVKKVSKREPMDKPSDGIYSWFESLNIDTEEMLINAIEISLFVVSALFDSLSIQERAQVKREPFSTISILDVSSEPFQEMIIPVTRILQSLFPS